MADPTSYIKLYRNILEWGWFDDPNTLKIWIYILCKVKYKTSEYYGIKIYPGEFAHTIEQIASDTKLSVKNVRTAINHLKKTGEVAIKRYPRFLVISVVNWKAYQGIGQSNGNQTAIKRQSKGTPTIYKEIKKERSSSDEDEWYDDQ